MITERLLIGIHILLVSTIGNRERAVWRMRILITVYVKAGSYQFVKGDDDDDDDDDDDAHA